VGRTKGSKHPREKALTYREVHQIRVMVGQLGNGTKGLRVRRVADKFNVTVQTINNIVRGDTHWEDQLKVGLIKKLGRLDLLRI